MKPIEPCPRRCPGTLAAGLRYGWTPRPVQVLICWDCGYEQLAGQDAPRLGPGQRACHWCGAYFVTFDPDQRCCTPAEAQRLEHAGFGRRSDGHALRRRSA